MTSETALTSLERFSTGIEGLDRVLDGGFFAGGVYLVEGVPGAGKTILANQVCFHHVRSGGGRALYVTLLAESHARLLQHLQPMAFFDGEIIPERLTYVSGFRTLESEGLKGLIELIRKEMRAQRASVVVLYGFAAVGDSAESDREFKKLVHELQVHAVLARCTFFLLSSGVSQVVHPVHTMVDGLVRLTDRVVGRRVDRDLNVHKFRGSGYLRGVHAFTITNAGIHVYPRIESLASPDQGPRSDDRLSFNIPRFDSMLGGGLPSESSTMLLGPSGVGKSSMGYKFLEGSTSECPGLAVSFYETEARALFKARSLGIDLEGPLTRGDLEFGWHRPTEISLDTLADQILRAVTRRRVRRLFIDGFNALLVASASPERVPQFFSALAEELRARGVTTLYTAELHEIFSPRIAPPAEGISPLLENLIVMRFVEVEATVRRLVSVLKMRASAFDPTLRELTLSSDGIAILDSFTHSEAVLKGSPRSANKRESAKKAGHKRKPEARRRR